MTDLEKIMDASTALDELIVLMNATVMELQESEDITKTQAYAMAYNLRSRLGKIVASLGVGVPPVAERQKARAFFDDLGAPDIRREFQRAHRRAINPAHGKPARKGLTDAQVLEIRRKHQECGRRRSSQVALAVEYGVSPAVISLAINGKRRFSRVVS